MKASQENRRIRLKKEGILHITYMSEVIHLNAKIKEQNHSYDRKRILTSEFTRIHRRTRERTEVNPGFQANQHPPSLSPPSRLLLAHFSAKLAFSLHLTSFIKTASTSRHTISCSSVKTAFIGAFSGAFQGRSLALVEAKDMTGVGEGRGGRVNKGWLEFLRWRLSERK